MKKILKIKGYPGTGKTTYLRDMIVNDLRELEPNEIAFSSFSRSTSQAIRDKLMAIGYNTVRFHEVFPYFRTLYSISAHELGLTEKDDFVDVKDYEDFCLRMGLGFVKEPLSSLEAVEELGYPKGFSKAEFGNEFFMWLQRLKKRYIYDKRIEAAILSNALIDHYPTLSSSSIPASRMLDLYREWEDYKRKRGKWEYEDMLQYLVIHPDPLSVKVFYIDEAQDLSPLQFKLVEIFSREAEKIVYAYDENQAIYFFNEANPNLVTCVKGEEHVLRKSYRLPRAVWEYAKEILKLIGDKYYKEIKVMDGGFFNYTYYSDFISSIQPNKRSFLLFRTHYLISKAKSMLIDEGFLIPGMGRAKYFVNSHRFSSLYNLLLKLEKKEEIKRDDIYDIIPHIPAKYFRKRGLKTKLVNKRVKFGNLISSLHGVASGYDFLTSVTTIEDANDIREFIDSPKYHIVTDDTENRIAKRILLEVDRNSKPICNDIYIGTIFAAKGLETDRTFLFDYFIPGDTELKAERLLSYVGLTRCREGVYLISPDGYEDSGFIYDMVMRG